MTICLAVGVVEGPEAEVDDNYEEIHMDKQVYTPLKDKTPYGWHFEQNVVDPRGKCYALKASEGSGNRVKVLLYEELDAKIYN